MKLRKIILFVAIGFFGFTAPYVMLGLILGIFGWLAFQWARDGVEM